MVPCETCQFSVYANKDFAKVMKLRRKHDQPCLSCEEDFKNHKKITAKAVKSAITV